MRAELDRMLALGVIEPSNSPVASPIVKPDGSVRLCLDSRRLNSLTIRDQFPVPNILHIFAQLPKCLYLSSIDLGKAFWQIGLCSRKKPGKIASSQQLTAFIFPGRGLYHFRVMPFGLSNSPATMCRAMHHVIAHDLEPKVFVYMDDIIVLTHSVEEMLVLLEQIAGRLRKSNLSVNLPKCRFFAKELKYLCYLVSPDVVKADPSKLWKNILARKTSESFADS